MAPPSCCLVVAAITISLVAVNVVASTDDALKRTSVVYHHSLVPPFLTDWWQEGIPHWEVGGDAVVTDAFVRLTPQHSSRSGWIWNTLPNEMSDWEIKMIFAVHGKRAPGADGIGLWYVQDAFRTPEGPLFGNKNDFKGLGIILDTYDNDGLRDNPAVNVLANLDGSKSRWGLERDLRDDTMLRCQFDFRQTTAEDPAELVVTYHQRMLSVRLRIRRRSIDVPCGEVHVDLPIGYYFGATASTGGVVDNHDIMSIEVRGVGDSAEDHSVPLEHFDAESDQRERSFWGPQNRNSNRER